MLYIMYTWALALHALKKQYLLESNGDRGDAIHEFINCLIVDAN